MSMNTAPVEALTVNALFDLTHTAAAPLLSAVTYPWEVLDDLGVPHQPVDAAGIPAKTRESTESSARFVSFAGF